ncbi:MAG: T9SS type A sorting domain-containing protein, partial [Ignavibacteriaceae bacterium]|nr:T9SS type A sorting domain-containing protein [Ignavibacteriaceae bacterium]
SVFFTNELIGWIGGGFFSSWDIRHPPSSVILKTTNGGGVVNVVFNIPESFLLKQNYPNPFNPITKIKYQIPELSFVTLKVYDVLGSEVATLVNEEKPVGNYEIKFNGIGLTSGIYFYQLRAVSFVETKKMVFMK